jgi:OHCU decarboxylase
MRLADLNALDQEAAAGEFLRCCGSSRWSGQMAAGRPFADAVVMSAVADAIWWALDRQDWLEAFAAHPRIGAGRAVGAGLAGEGGGGGRVRTSWSDEEQAGVADAGDETRRRLVEANREYEVRFGHIFIVCATGRTAGEMLALLEGRLRHDPDDELRVAAEEQRRITQLRLRKLVEPEADGLS